MGDMDGSPSPKIHDHHFKYFNIFLQLLFLLGLGHGLLVLPASMAATIVDAIPGYPANLPFRLETGYFGVGEEEQVQLFYYFIESETNPETDPLLLWLTGGPGCSALSGLVLETGPLNFDYSDASLRSEIPKLKLNPYSWTKAASIIFLDSPVGTGFSYATTSQGYYSDDIKASRHTYEFLQKWLLEHVEFQKNPLYISGDSYSGITVPIVVQEVLNGNRAAIGPLMNLKGYILGNPLTVVEDRLNSKYEFARRVSLISDELYEAARVSCDGDFDLVYGRNIECKKNLQAIIHNIDPLFDGQILEPTCNTTISPKWCRDRDYSLFFIWANNLKVQEALHIREGTKIHWVRCNKTLAYTHSVKISFGYHQNFTKESFHAVIYSGDQDLAISNVGTRGWIRKLNLPIIDRWRPWFAKGQVAGYTTKYSNGHYHLTFATVKGAGHTAPEYKPQECLTMLTKWFKNHPL